ncbi:MAG: SdpI family protein [Candidatus Pacebacteria bacterium]|nr:SdpI family protein [Candidatus Paceibacterota bacterium]MDD5621347.1 SdpI family protein [Candidatus Paceibacterota bacterium]
MNKKIYLILSLLLILASFLIGYFIYPQMPERMASHWNGLGQVDGYMSRAWALYMMPVLALIMFILMLFIPKLDPLKKNVKKFQEYYYGFILGMIAFLFYIYLLTIFWNLGMRFSMIRSLVPAFAILFYYCGILLEKAKQNWFIGIKTAWTLSNEEVWNKTHKLGGKLFKLAGVISLIGLFFEKVAIWLVTGPILLASIFIVFYSYWVYKKIKK